MAVLVAVAMAVLLVSVRALTDKELAMFTARTHSERNTGIQGTVKVTVDGDYYRIESNGIPDHDTGKFPGKGNPNNLVQHSHSERFYREPKVAATATCLPVGPIAWSRNGVPIFNPFNNQGQNAVEGETAEMFDNCAGHPDVKGIYHYHQTPKCLYGDSNDEFVGVALDGFPIYGVKDSGGVELKTADLDQCHGQLVNGKYRYRMTYDFPYVMGCFRGTPSPDIKKHRLESATCKIIGKPSTTTATPPGGTTTRGSSAACLTGTALSVFMAAILSFILLYMYR